MSNVVVLNPQQDVVVSEVKMNSLEFLNQVINPARETAGESTVTNAKFKLRVMDELDLTESVGHFFQPPTGGTPQLVFDLDYEQMTLVGMRESKAVRRSVLETLKQLQAQLVQPTPVPLTKREALLMALEAEERAEAAEAQLAIEQKATEAAEAKAERMAQMKVETQTQLDAMQQTLIIMGRGDKSYLSAVAKHSATEISDQLKAVKYGDARRCSPQGVLIAATQRGWIEPMRKGYQATEAFVIGGFGKTDRSGTTTFTSLVHSDAEFLQHLTNYINK